ncbi:MAG: hydantoinase/oxoprolinase family protein, partial [Mariprofundaceae bacterium]
QGITEMGLEAGALHLVHGSTVATNAILERKGVRTLFVTNHGMEHLLAIGRQTRDNLYELCPPPKQAWLPLEDTLGMHGRLDADGASVAPMDSNELDRLASRASTYEAVAVCTLFSFLNPEHELAIADALPESVSVSLSHQVLPEYREYERAATTFLNAYVGPKVQHYLKNLETELAPKHLFIMHSAGGIMAADEASKYAVRMVLSGPAGGLVAAQHIGEQLHTNRLMSFDMGGTSTDVSLIDETATISIEGSIAGLPIAVPMLDIHTIGAGGGSIAWCDAAGLLQVGPESAGADPGPVCYGKGGTQPTVTDANIILGRIPSGTSLAGTLPLSVASARNAVSSMAASLDMDAEALAEGILRIAEEHMAGALRVVSVQRGHDPRTFALLCFGGAGGLHACHLAEQLEIPRVIVPLGSGAFSALGMLTGCRQLNLSRSHRMDLAASNTPSMLKSMFEALKEQAHERMPGLGLCFEYQLDLRYEGQGFHLTLPLEADTQAQKNAFEAAHERAYGHVLAQPVEIMTVRLTAYAETPTLELPELPVARKPLSPAGESSVYGTGIVPHLWRKHLRPGHSWQGPALVLEDTATLWLPDGWQMTVSEHGHLLLDRGATP